MQTYRKRTAYCAQLDESYIGKEEIGRAQV